MPNLDRATVDHFGEEWSSFTQDEGWGSDGLDKVFAQYFAPLPSGALNLNAVVGDLGAGSGRWATKVAPLVSHLYVLEPSPAAMSVARKNLSRFSNVSYIAEPIGGPSMPEGRLDVAYSLGVIHHIPDPEQALQDVRATLKPGGIFLGYLYYALDNRPSWFKTIWRVSDKLRSWVSPLPASRKRWVTDSVAALVYWPLARASRLLSRLGVPVDGVPLSQYSDKSFYVMRNDALDRLGTPLEYRFTRTEITEMLLRAGFDTSTLFFSESAPFWCFSIRTSDHGD
jgi:SAM-dependent methyltransferase